MIRATTEVLNRLKGVKRGVSPTDWVSLCPSHQDKHRSLSISEKAGTLLLHCFSGCDGDAIVQALGLTWGDILNADNPRKPPPLARHREEPPPAETRRIPYGLTTPAGELVAVHTRIEYADGSKRFEWSRNGKLGLAGLAVADVPLWGLKRLAAFDYAADPNCSEPYVILCEGEKAALSLWERVIPAVGTATGASAAGV